MQIAPDRRAGRASASNPATRFDAHARERFDDGWGEEPDLPPVRTEVIEERPRRMVTANESPDIPFDASLNPYRGCEHGCIYCFARPFHAYLGLSPGLDFETRLVAKIGAAERLARDFAARGYEPKPIMLGTATDPYQPMERDRRITRALIEVLAAHRHPFVIVTRGTLIERDLDLLGPLAADGLLHVGVSVTTLDPALSRRMEPRAPAPARRLATIARLAGAGVPVRVMAAPMIPALTDHELESIFAAGAAAGARAGSTIPVRLPREVATLFQAWLDEHAPDRAARVMGRIRQMQGGQDYDPSWGTRFTGQGEWAKLLARRVDVARRKSGLSADLPDLRRDLFAVPKAPDRQMALF